MLQLKILPDRSELRRIGLETALAFSCVALAAQGPDRISGMVAPQPRPDAVNITTATGDAYRLPARYDGLLAEESWSGGTLRLVAYEGQRDAPFEFDFGLGLAFAGSTMYEITGKSIPPGLKADFLTARASFCQHAATRAISSERVRQACPTPERIPGA